MEENTYDVAICGGGLAGSTLARQLRRTLPSVSVAVLDTMPRPLPEAAHKVGESTVEVGAHYLTTILGLESYFKERQLYKHGLRYFFGNTRGPLEERPEYGLSDWPAHVCSHQMDRGILENDLREFNQRDGVEVLEGCHVQDAHLHGHGEQHEVIYRKGTTGAERALRCRWLVDATGRRRLLQQKLSLTIRNPQDRHSAAWWRLPGRIDVADLVPRSNTAWHGRVRNNNRYFSTTHLMGDGYWFWLIALASGCTSVGIVTKEDMLPVSEYCTFERATKWLEDHEPQMAAYLAGRTPLDFLTLKDYSYSSSRAFSTDRWSCVGEAAVFSDPFYSPGTDVLGIGNSITVDMIRLDLEGQLTPEIVEQRNSFFLGYNSGVTHYIHSSYPYHGHDLMMACKLLWDFASGWSLNGPLMFNRLFNRPEVQAELRKVTAPYIPLLLRVHSLLKDWVTKSRRSNTFEFLDYLSIPFLANLRQRNLQTNKGVDELVADHAANLEILEEMAQAIFLLAVEDLYPSEMARFPEPAWVNAWGISLSPANWERDKLFLPKSAPRPRSEVRSQFRKQFRL